MKKLSIILVLLWMAFIFYNSSRNASISNETSFKFLNLFKHTTNNLINDNKKADIKNNASQNNTNSTQIKLPKTKKEQKQNLIIRKNAHAFEYIVLAVLVSNMLIIHGMKMKDAVIYILFICLFYAVTDEFHQQFVSGRSPLVSDVLIDFTGSNIGVIVYYIIKFKPIYKKLSS